MTFIQEKVEEAKQQVWGYCCKSCGGGGAGETPESTCPDCKGLGIVNWNFDYLTTTLTQAIEEGRRMERERIETFVNANYSRSFAPLYAHVDAKELLNLLTPPSTGDNTPNV